MAMSLRPHVTPHLRRRPRRGHGGGDAQQTVPERSAKVGRLRGVMPTHTIQPKETDFPGQNHARLLRVASPPAEAPSALLRLCRLCVRVRAVAHCMRPRAASRERQKTFGTAACNPCALLVRCVCAERKIAVFDRSPAALRRAGGASPASGARPGLLRQAVRPGRMSWRYRAGVPCRGSRRYAGDLARPGALDLPFGAPSYWSDPPMRRTISWDCAH
jgi:hypothetical protein